MSADNSIVSLDPGGTTGAAFCCIADEQELDRWGFRSWEIGGKHTGLEFHHNTLRLQLEMINPGLIVCEDFIFRQHTGESGEISRTRVELISKEYIGVARLYCIDTDTPFILQTPSQGLQFVRDKRLKALGLYTPGQPHANDALRHLLYYLVFTRKLRYPFVQFWKPSGQHLVV